MAIKGPFSFGSPRVTTLLFDLDGTLVDLRPSGLRILFFARAIRRFAGAIPLWKIPTAFSRAKHDLQNNVTEKTNYEVFLNTLSSYAKSDPGEIERRTRLLISDDFARFSSSFVPILHAYETLLLARELGYGVVLATNPVWPLDAVMMRAHWGGLRRFEFDFISHSEIMTRAKPHPEYYRELLGKLDAAPEDCLMIGNDPVKDLPARTAGIHTFLLERPETAKNWTEITKDPRLDCWGSHLDLQEWMRANAPNAVAGENR